jgi:hypothetical protein
MPVLFSTLYEHDRSANQRPLSPREPQQQIAFARRPVKKDRGLEIGCTPFVSSPPCLAEAIMLHRCAFSDAFWRSAT